MKKVKETSTKVKVFGTRLINLVIAISLALVGMSVLHYINLPEFVVKFVGYLLIISAVYYTYRNFK